MELLSNEYHLLGPVASSVAPHQRGCSYDCGARATGDTVASRGGRGRRVIDANHRDGVCDCEPRRRERPPSRRPEEALAGTLTDVDFTTTEPIFHSTRLSEDEAGEERDRVLGEEIPCDCEVASAIGRRGGEVASPIAGPSRSSPAKRARPLPAADENGDEGTYVAVEGDPDCTCGDVDVVEELVREEELPRRRPREVVGAAEEDEDDEEGTEDSAYRELSRRGPRRRSRARERELKRWIRRCRRECEQRRRRRRGAR